MLLDARNRIFVMLLVASIPACLAARADDGKSVEDGITGKRAMGTMYLLLDERIVESTVNAKLMLGTVKKHESNPLSRGDKP